MKKTIHQYYINARVFRPEISQHDFIYLYSQMKSKCNNETKFTVSECTDFNSYKDGVCTVKTFTLIDACGYSYFEIMSVTREYK